MTRHHGTVIRYDGSYGFLRADEPEIDGDVFVHWTAIDMPGYRRLIEGQRVTFALVQSERGLRADAVEIDKETKNG
jgi:CspA family cold shock protein